MTFNCGPAGATFTSVAIRMDVFIASNGGSESNGTKLFEEEES